MSESDLEPCPKCKSIEHVERVHCRCMSCPPLICRNPACRDRGPYEFFWSDDDE